MRLDGNIDKSRLYALKIMLGENTPIKIMNEDVVNEDIVFDVLNDKIDYINYAAKEDIDDTIRNLILESNVLEGDNRVCFVIDDSFIENSLLKDYVVALNNFGAEHGVKIDLIVESPYTSEIVPHGCDNVEFWYGLDIESRPFADDLFEDFLNEYKDKQKRFELALEHYFESYRPKIAIASTPITIKALDIVASSTESKCVGLVKFGNAWSFKKHGVFGVEEFHDYFIDILKDTSIPLAVETKEMFSLVHELIEDENREILELPTPTEMAEETLGLVYSDLGVFIEDNGHIEEETYSTMFSVLAPIGVSVTIATAEEKRELVEELVKKSYIGNYNIITNRGEMFYNFIKRSHKIYMDLSKEGVSEDILNSEKSILHDGTEEPNVINYIKKVVIISGNPSLKKSKNKDIVLNYSTYVNEIWGDILGDRNEY